MKRTLCIFLSIIMLLSVLPITAYADDVEVSTFQQLKKAFDQNKDSITLTSDIEYEVPSDGNQLPSASDFLMTLTGDDSITLDLNGHTLKVVNRTTVWFSQSALFTTYDNSSLTVMNGSVIVYNYNATANSAEGAFLAENNSYLVLQDVNVTNARNGRVVAAQTNSTLTIEGGTIMAYSGFAVSGFGSANINLAKNVRLTTSDGTGVAPQSGNAGQGSISTSSPNLSLGTVAFDAGVVVPQAAISAFEPSSSRLVFLGETQYETAFPQTRTGDYYWYQGTGGYQLVKNQKDVYFALDLQIVSTKDKQYVFVTDGNGRRLAGYAAYGDTVNISATVPAGKEFDHWYVKNGGVSLDNSGQRQTSFVMGADRVELEAIYKNAQVCLTGASFSLNFPVHDSKPGAVAVSNTAGVTVRDEEVYWVEMPEMTPLKATSKFEENVTYRAVFSFDIDENYYFAEDFSDNLSITDSATGAVIKATSGANNFIVVADYTVPERTIIQTATATVTALAGQRVSQTSVSDGDSRYTVSIRGWYDTTDALMIDSVERMDDNAVLEGGKTYCVAVLFMPASGYKMPGNAEVTINGSRGKVGGSYSGGRYFGVKITIPEILNGWVNQGGVNYYYIDNVLQTNKLFKYEGNWYYTNADGSMYMGWTAFGSNWRYFGSDGVMAIGLKKLDNGNWYYFNNSGIRQSGKIAFGNNWRFFKEDGVMATGLTKVEGKWYFLNSSGLKQCNYWQDLGNYKRFFGSDGVMVTGLKKIDGSWYYFNDSGIMQKGWVKFGSNMRYFKPDGVMATGLTKATNGNWYYFNGSGIRQYGWQKFGSNYRYFDKSSGVMLASCTKKIDGKNYTFNASGICTNK